MWPFVPVWNTGRLRLLFCSSPRVQCVALLLTEAGPAVSIFAPAVLHFRWLKSDRFPKSSALCSMPWSGVSPCCSVLQVLDTSVPNRPCCRLSWGSSLPRLSLQCLSTFSPEDLLTLRFFKRRYVDSRSLIRLNVAVCVQHSTRRQYCCLQQFSDVPFLLHTKSGSQLCIAF